jgi:DNA modification methylase
MGMGTFGGTATRSAPQGAKIHPAVGPVLGFEKILGKGDMLAYLVGMAVRFAEIWRVLKPTGSFYVHCDPTASHYFCISRYSGIKR